MSRRLVAEAIGTAVLLYVILGSTFMGAQPGTDETAQLLAQAIVVGRALGVAIAIFQPISGSHFDPSVTLAFWRSNTMAGTEALRYMGAQLIGAVTGVIAANWTFDDSPIAMSGVERSGIRLVGSEAVATFLLVLVISMLVRGHRPSLVPLAVGAWVTAVIFGPSSTGFANPAVTIARVFTSSWAGIAPLSVVPFVLVQLAAGLAAVPMATYMHPQPIARPSYG
jgi:glycerol uptake facilitator-like aquaporin